MKSNLAICCLAICALVALCAWQSVRISELERENALLTYKTANLLGTNERCDEQITQCWAWRSRMEIELKAYANDCKSWLRKQESIQ